MADSKTSGGASGTTLLQIAFIVLKLCKVIDWSWWWVLSPLWITVSLSLIALGIYAIYCRRKSKNDKERLKSGLSSYYWEKRKAAMKDAHKIKYDPH